MKKLYKAALIYVILGLISGMFTRYFLEMVHFEGETQLNLLHFHILVVGMVVNLVWLVLDGVFKLSRDKKWFSLAFWHYNAGVALTLVGMLLIGLHQTTGAQDVPGMYAGISGIGHIVLSVGFGMFFYLLYKALPRTAEK